MAYAQSGHMKLLAVSDTQDGEVGGIADLYLEINSGTGRVFLETFPLTKVDTQISTRLAKEIACDFADIDCSKYDFFYTITADSPIIAGPSAGAAITILTFSLIKNVDFKEDVAITGTINSGGLVGPVGGLKAKIEAASKDGIKKALIPLGEAIGGGNIILADNETAPGNETFSLEELTSSKYITFMERSLNNAFAPSRNTGFMLHNHMLDKRMTWSGGVFRNADGFGDSEGDETTEGGYSLSGRITALPWYEDEGRQLIHIGFSLSRQNAFKNSVRFSETPEMHMAKRFVDTGAFGAESFNLFNPELAFVYGPFSLQTEYTLADVELENSTDSDPDFSGYYVSGSYFLTGESRKYKTKGGVFDRVKPNRSFEWGKSPGAIELTARYSQLDLSDEKIRGGRLNDVTLGINWYLNPNTRVMMNYVMADVNRSVGGTRLSDDDANLFGMRFQIDF